MLSDNIKIKILLKKHPLLLANAMITIESVYFGEITIKNFQIWKSKNFNERLREEINITPPTQKVYAAYIPIVFWENKEKWYELEEIIYSNYLKKKPEAEINIDDIPDDFGK